MAEATLLSLEEKKRQGAIESDEYRRRARAVSQAHRKLAGTDKYTERDACFAWLRADLKRDFSLRPLPGPTAEACYQAILEKEAKEEEENRLWWENYKKEHFPPLPYKHYLVTSTTEPPTLGLNEASVANANRVKVKATLIEQEEQKVETANVDASIPRLFPISNEMRAVRSGVRLRTASPSAPTPPCASETSSATGTDRKAWSAISARLWTCLSLLLGTWLAAFLICWSMELWPSRRA